MVFGGSNIVLRYEFGRCRIWSVSRELVVPISTAHDSDDAHNDLGSGVSKPAVAEFSCFGRAYSGRESQVIWSEFGLVLERS